MARMLFDSCKAFGLCSHDVWERARLVHITRPSSPHFVSSLLASGVQEKTPKSSQASKTAYAMLGYILRV